MGILFNRGDVPTFRYLDPAKEFTVVQKASTTQTIEIEIHVKNLGQTLAHDVTWVSWVYLGPWPLPQEFKFTGPSGGEPGKSVLPSGGIVSFHTGTGRPLTSTELADVNSGKLSLCVYGRIEYRDVWGRRHWTNFCQGSTALATQGFRSHWAKCNRHNDADSD